MYRADGRKLLAEIAGQPLNKGTIAMGIGFQASYFSQVIHGARAISHEKALGIAEILRCKIEDIFVEDSE